MIVMLRHVYDNVMTRYMLWIGECANPNRLGRRVLKFGLREFAIIIGLKCHEIPDINHEDIKRYLNVMFNISTAGTDDDRIKMANMYFLESFLIPKQDCLSIDWDHIIMVDDDEVFDGYPWGRVAFELLVDFINRIVCSKGQTRISIGGLFSPFLLGLTSFNVYKVFCSFLKQLEVSHMLATPIEVGMPYFAPFMETEKDILKEAEDKLRKTKNSNHIAHVSLNRGVPSTSGIDGLTRMVEKIENSQKRMETSVKELKMNN
uniref:DUF1985 domain-containing protein n=1 Tax=Cucumis melo TaxID=3656 RepID=A0A9I9ED87_CUCME